MSLALSPALSLSKGCRRAAESLVVSSVDPGAGGTEGTGILTAEEEAADLGVLEQVVAFPGHGDLARD